MSRYTRRQKLMVAMALPFGVTVLAVNIAGAFGASEPTKDRIILAGLIACLIGTGWAIWTWTRKPKD